MFPAGPRSAPSASAASTHTCWWRNGCRAARDSTVPATARRTLKTAIALNPSPWSAWMPASAPGRACRPSGSGCWVAIREHCLHLRQNGGESRRVPGSGSKGSTVPRSRASTWTMFQSPATVSASPPARWRRCCPSSCSCSRPQPGPCRMPAWDATTTAAPASSSA